MVAALSSQASWTRTYVPNVASDRCRQWRALMARATERLDLTEVYEALESWRQVAWVTSAHGAEVYRRTLASAEERLQSRGAGRGGAAVGAAEGRARPAPE